MSQETRPSVHWPPVQWEERPWKSAMAGALGVPRRARADHEGPYRSAVLVPIASLDVVLPGAVTALADDASTQIARFDAGLEGDITPFAAVLLRSESASSSRIENLTSGAEDLARAEIGAATTSNAELVVGNVRGMQAAIALADRLDGDSILAMHAALLEEHEPHLAGRWRDQQVWIGGTGFGPHLAAFVPPHHDRVPAAIGDLVAFVRRDDLPVLVQAAVAHAQFETIHPFPDGNGRTGRALLHAMLAAKGLTRNVTVPISAGLLSDTRSYFDALTAFRDGDLTPIVERVSHAAFSAMSNGALLVAELRAVRAGWDALITARRDAAVHRLADVVLRQPVLDVAVAVHRLGVSPVAAQNAVDALVRIGALQAIGDRRRNRLWQAPEVTAALDAFAVRAGRRG